MRPAFRDSGSGRARRMLTEAAIVCAMTMTAHAQWTVVNLHPSGDYFWSYASGVHGGQQVGRTWNSDHAILWGGSADSFVDLHPISPPDLAYSRASGVHGGRQVGYVDFYDGGVRFPHASLWSGSAATWVNINPPGATYSAASGVYGDLIVGEADVPFTQAVVWVLSGGVWNWSSLNPVWADWSLGEGVYGNQVVGEVYTAADDLRRASLWTFSQGTWSWLSLHPAAATASSAHGVYDGQQVGDAWVGDIERASLWTGTAGSWVDLHPDIATASAAMGVYNGVQVGTVYLGGISHASLWTGTKESWADLHAFVPPECTHSQASGIWGDGISTYVVGWGRYRPFGYPRALMWVLADCNGNGIPDSTEPDADDDGRIDDCDNCPTAHNPGQEDQDDDDVGDACDSCSGTVPGANVDESGCPEVIPGDFNRDGDVDPTDFGAFRSCANGMAMPYGVTCALPPDPDGHIAADFDNDFDVDQDDFGVFQRCYSGEDHPADPNCAN